MNMVTALTSAALKPLTAETVTASIIGTALALTDICERFEARSISSVLKSKGFDCSKPIDGWSLPDAVWLAICRKQLSLNSYPLGEIAERAVKKTLIHLIVDNINPDASENSLNQSERELQQHLRRALKALGHNGLLRLFLSQYFFETSIDYLRRPSGNPKSDFSYGYNFSKRKRMISLKSEQKFTQTLNKQCAALATKFFPSSNRGRLNAQSIGRRIRTGLEQKLGLQMAGLSAASKPVKPVVNGIVGLTRLTKAGQSYNIAKKTKRFILSGKSRNIRCSLDLKTWLGHSPHPLVQDLVELGITIYMADLHMGRKEDLERRLGLLMPVHYPAVWSAAREHLRQAVVNLGRDDFEIYFTKCSDKAGRAPRISLVNDNRCVCLFSGGIDSIAGATWLLDNKMTPILVSHNAIAILASNIQRPLVKQLEENYKRQLTSFQITELTLENLKRARVPNVVLEKLQSLQGRGFLTPAKFSQALKKKIGDKHLARYESLILKHARGLPHISFFLGRRLGNEGKYRLGGTVGGIMAQHLRSFLFLSVAAAVAIESRISTVYICENGPVALNPLFSEARVNTRTAHPHVLGSFQALIKTVFGVELRIENPFAYLTKGEVTNILAREKQLTLLKQTSSCWSWFNVLVKAKKKGIIGFKGNHDGDCLPCIHRRAAVDRAGLWASDATYLEDVFNGYPKLNRDTIIALADFIRFCANVASASDAEILLRAPDFSVYQDSTETRKLIEMYRAHAKEVIRCFQTRSNEKFRRDFAAVLNS